MCYPSPREVGTWMAPNGEIDDPPRQGLWQWFWRGAELRAARRELRDLPEEERSRLRRASMAYELGDRAFDPIEPLRSGSSLPLSLSLYREAAYWALLAQDASREAADLGGAFSGCSEEELRFAAGGAEGLADVERALVAKTFRDTALDDPKQQAADARAARAFVKTLIDRKLGPERRIGRLLVQRGVRMGMTLLTTVALLVGGVLLYKELTTGPDLAKGKPWRTSSTNEGVPKAAKNEYFFHTLEEKNPWVEIDLQQATPVSVVNIINRRDCCPDRAVPAVVEVSTDQERWHEVARRADTFSSWRARFTPTRARYVRVRAAKRTILHLSAVQVRAE